MKHELSELELIELARKAKPVPVDIGSTKKAGAPKAMKSSISEFMSKTGLKSGRNQVDCIVIYDAYKLWAKDPLDLKAFITEFNKFMKKPNMEQFKVNMHPVTLLEIIKELNQHEEEKHQG